MPRVGVPKGQAMPAPPASSWHQTPPGKGWAAQERGKEQIKLVKTPW